MALVVWLEARRIQLKAAAQGIEVLANVKLISWHQNPSRRALLRDVLPAFEKAMTLEGDQWTIANGAARQLEGLMDAFALVDPSLKLLQSKFIPLLDRAFASERYLLFPAADAMPRWRSGSDESTDSND